MRNPGDAYTISCYPKQREGSIYINGLNSLFAQLFINFFQNFFNFSSEKLFVWSNSPSRFIFSPSQNIFLRRRI